MGVEYVWTDEDDSKLKEMLKEMLKMRKPDLWEEIEDLIVLNMTLRRKEARGDFMKGEKND